MCEFGESISGILFEQSMGGLRRKNRNVVVSLLTAGAVPLQQAEQLLTRLSRAEKAQILQWVVRDLGEDFPGIDTTPGVCGGEPCIVRTRIPVWVLEQARRLGVSEAELLRSYPTLRAEDLAQAWAYARSHREEIERQIRENDYVP